MNLRELTTLSTFKVNDRTTGHTVHVGEHPVHVGDHVMLDGKKMLVTGITNRWSRDTGFEVDIVGLVVRDAERPNHHV